MEQIADRLAAHIVIVVGRGEKIDQPIVGADRVGGVGGRRGSCGPLSA